MNRSRSNTISIKGPNGDVGYTLQPEDLTQSQPRRTTLSGTRCRSPALLPGGIQSGKTNSPSLHSYPLSPPLSANESTKSRSLAEPVRNTPSPVPSSSGSSSSGKFVRFSHSEDYINLQDPPRYSPRALKRAPSRSVLKDPELKPANTLSPVVAASSATIDTILRELIAHVKAFKCPSELDFSVDIGSPLILANVEKNQEFINQLRRFDRLRGRLNAVSTYGDAQLENKHKATGVAIKRVLQRMKERQLQLYEQFTMAVECSLENISIDLKFCVREFEYPARLDFPANSEGLVLRNTERNRPFIDQLRRLDWFREALNSIPKHGNEQLQERRSAINVAIGRHIRRLRTHQLNLYRLQSAESAN